MNLYYHAKKMSSVTETRMNLVRQIKHLK